MDCKLYGRRPVARPRLKWEEVRRDSSLLLNIVRGQRRPRPDAGCCAVGDDDDEEGEEAAAEDWCE